MPPGKRPLVFSWGQGILPYPLWVSPWAGGTPRYLLEFFLWSRDTPGPSLIFSRCPGGGGGGLYLPRLLLGLVDSLIPPRGFSWGL